MLLVSSPLHLIPDVVGHLLVEAELLPLLVEVGGLAVPAHVAVEAASDVGVQQVLSGLDVEGCEEPGVALEKVFLMVTASRKTNHLSELNGMNE